ncbi:MAG: DUF2075 domain-containing protein, partial [Erysipelotrichaceae bacterium]|nr:DUF2075 domain-containing protein [Erysipelotrichaceae bacterium]
FDFRKNRIDFLVYGKNDNDINSMVVVELKQWSKSSKTSKKMNYVYTSGPNGDMDYLHPSFQSYAYKSTLEGFNEYVQDNNVDIASCSYLHNMSNNYDFVFNDYDKYPFVVESPVFLQDDEDKLRAFVKKHVTHGNRKLLYEINNGAIRPSKYFSTMLANAINGQPVFTLDDEQANSVSTIIYEVVSAIEHKKRKTIIIKGGHGSGKSAVAINALGQLIHAKDGNRYNACYCTTNFTPRTLFSEILVDNDYKKTAINSLFKTLATFSRVGEFEYDCVIIDEAHRSFKWKFGQGIRKDVDMIGKVFYSSRVNVFFIDEDQVVTKDDYLTIERIKGYATRYKSEIIEGEELHLTSQFRCLGGENYIRFINSLLGYDNNKVKYRSSRYDFKVFDSPSELWEAIKEKQADYPKTRLLAGYTHEWVSKTDDTQYDFDMDNGRFRMKWNKNVSHSYINDADQYDRIGCIHTIQGVDMDYAGVILGKDIKYRNGMIVFDQSENAKTDSASG